MAHRRTLTLTEEQKRELMRIRDRDSRPWARERCAAMLKIAVGQSPHWVAKKGLLKERDPDTVYFWLGLYEADGLAGLLSRQPGGARRRRL
jgi:hypothetical protein